MTKQRPTTYIFAAAALVLASWFLWLRYGGRHEQPKTWTAAPPAQKVDSVPKVDHHAPPKIKVVPKKIAGKQLDLPPEITSDSTKQIIATADVAKAPHGATVVAVMDTATGDSQILVKANPRPFFEFLRTGSAGVRYGIDTNGHQQAAVFIRQDVLRIANVHLAATAEARTVPSRGTSEGIVSAELSYRWQ